MMIEIRGTVNVKKRFTSAIIVVLAALLSVFVCLFAHGSQSVSAENAGTVTLHVYDASQGYSDLACWSWVKGDAGFETAVNATAADDEKFFKEYEDNNGATVKNVAHTFDIALDAEQLQKVKGGTPLGVLVCRATGKTGGDFWNRYEKETVDVFIDLSAAFDSNNHADAYYVRKDSAAFTDIEEALQSLEKIISARFTTKTAKSVTVEFEATSPVKSSAKATLFADGTEVAKAAVSPDEKNGCKATAAFNAVFDFSSEYSIKVEGVATGCLVNKVVFVDDPEFIAQYENADTQSLEYGSIYTPQKTTFRVWAPFASSVWLNMYADDSSMSASMMKPLAKRIPDGGKWGGVWELEVEGDLNGKYYTYSVVNSGVSVETIDPYAKACGANGLRGMVVDLASTAPVGWNADKHLHALDPLNADTPIVWEVTVSDFSASADSGMKYKGKYLAFTERNTTVPGTSFKTGVDYLKDLGITYVHLNPVYDFGTVDEADVTRADASQFNWGYDPQNYNIPEGSYSTDPARGEVRINEFKQMVMALHKAGIGVIMDVVYNHTYSTNGQALHDTVPYYYHRTDENGKFTDGSGCSNETASERTMMRKYIVDSVVYWATEYHIDGFRFDLMGIHDVTTLQAVRDALDALDGGDGKKLLMYGEPWAADGSYIAQSFKNRTAVTKSGVTGYALNPEDNKMVKTLFAGEHGEYPREMYKLPERVAVFNDSGREGLRGNNDPGRGWVNGNPSGGLSGVKKMLEGGTSGNIGGMSTGNGARNVAYAAAHDNYTLWDQIRGLKHNTDSPLSYDYADPAAIKQCKLAASVYLCSTGISFMLAGDEMGRTKYGNENSYNSPTKLNQIVWSRQIDFKSLVDFNKSLIALRKKYSAALFSYLKCGEDGFCWGNFGDGGNGETGEFSFTRTQGGVTLEMTLNPTAKTGTIQIGADKLTI